MPHPLPQERSMSLSFTNESRSSYSIKMRTLQRQGSVDRRGMLNSIVKERFDPAWLPGSPAGYYLGQTKHQKRTPSARRPSTQ
jgi:hypothetical protein